MARPNDISELGSIGPGSVPRGAVEDVSLRNPDRDTLALSAHVKNPRRAHMASSTGIVDSGGYFTSEDVEGALQEIGGASSSGRQNGVVTGFGYSAVGLVVTFDSPSEALSPGLRDYSGETIALPDNTLSIWVYLDSSGNIAQVSAANPPSITSPENVLLWQFVTSAGVISAARDARIYVRNLDRKLPFTVRSSGTQADQESEACFVSLEAAITYLQYSTPLGSLRSEVVIRGPVSSGSIDIPVDGVHFRGEDGAEITLTGGPYLFDLQGHSGTSFQDLTFRTDAVGATAIEDSVGSSANSIPTGFLRCVFDDGTSSWNAGIDLTVGVSRLAVSTCQISAVSRGISVADPSGVVVSGTEVSAIGFAVGTVGIRLGTFPVTTPSPANVVRGCTVVGFDVGVDVVGEAPVVSQCKVTPGASGAVGIQVGPGVGALVSGNYVDCATGGGEVSLLVDGTSADVVGLRVSDNIFYGSRTYGIDFQGGVLDSELSGNTVDGFVPGSPNDPTAFAGIYIRTVGAPPRVPGYITVSGNLVTRSCTGIFVAGTSAGVVPEVSISGNVVHDCAVGIVGGPANPFQVSTGIGATYCIGLSCSSNNVSEIGTVQGVLPTPADVFAVGVLIRDCDRTAVSGNQIRELSVKGIGSAAGIRFDGPGTGGAFSAQSIRVTDNGVDSIPGQGIVLALGATAAAFARSLDGALVSGNTISSVGVGIYAYADGRGSIRDLRIENNIVDTTSTGNGIEVASLDASVGTPDGVVTGARVISNTVANATAVGIRLFCGDGATAFGLSVEGNQIRLPLAEGVSVVAGTAGGAGPASFGELSVSGNNLTMSPATVSAISLFTVSGSVTEVRMNNNTVSSAYDGISISAIGTGGPATNTTLLGWTFNQNSITASRRGFYGIVGGFVNRMSFLDNVVAAQDTVFQLAPGAVAPTATASNGILVSRNRMVASGVGAVNTRMFFTDQKVSGLHIEDNFFVGGASPGIGGVYVTVTGSGTGTDPSVRDLAVLRNSFRDMGSAGIAFAVPGPVDDAVDLALSGNTFEYVATDAGVPRSSVLICNIDATVRNMSVQGNRAVAFGHSATTHGGLDLTLRGVRGLDVSGNQFDSAVGLSSQSYGSIFHLESTAGGQNLFDCKIHGNKSRGVTVPALGSRLSLISIDLQGFSSAEQLSVCDNDLDRVNNGTGNTNGIRLETTTAFSGFFCDRNRVTGTGSTSAAMYLLVGAAGVTDASVSGNYVTGNASAGASGPGIRLNLAGTGTSIRVSGNTLFGNTGVPAADGILIDGVAGLTLLDARLESNSLSGYGSPISLECENLAGLEFSGNQVENFSNPVGGAAFKVVSSGNSRALTFNGNRCRTATDFSKGWLISLDDSCQSLTFSNNSVVLASPTTSTAMEIVTGVGVTFKNFAFTGNVFRGSTRGIVYTGGGTAPDSCTFTGNIGDITPSAGPPVVRSWSQFQNGGTAGWTNVLPDNSTLPTLFTDLNIDNGS